MLNAAIQHSAFAIRPVFLSACGSAPQPAAAPRGAADPVPASTPAAATAEERTSAPVFPLRVQGTGFVDSRGEPWSWRGITSFRLAEMLAAGREADVVRYLDWAAAQDLTVVRVLLMAEHLFTLAPEAGRDALPRLLDLARARGLAVEVVALADTRGRTMDLDAHVREVGRIALEKGNALVELANEPGHPTQDPRLHDPATLQRLFERMPPDLVVALGSAEYDPAYTAADYATYHFPREPEWGHVLALAEGAAMLARWQKPVINDEPIGADVAYRSRTPRQRAGALCRGGRALAPDRPRRRRFTTRADSSRRCRTPRNRLRSMRGRRGSGWCLIRPAVARGSRTTRWRRFARVSGARAVFARGAGDGATLLLIDPGADASVTWRDGWIESGRGSTRGVMVVSATRRD